jgi:hypothetical protein
VVRLRYQRCIAVWSYSIIVVCPAEERLRATGGNRVGGNGRDRYRSDDIIGLGARVRTGPWTPASRVECALDAQ